MQFPIVGSTNEGDREALCRRCGASCHMAIEAGAHKYILEEIHCRFLARESGGRYHCTVYEKRFEVAPWCHTADDALKAGHLATDCPYAAETPGFQGKEWAPPPVRAKLVPIARKKLIDDGLPLSANPDSALKLLNTGGELWTYTEQSDRFTFHRSRNPE